MQISIHASRGGSDSQGFSSQGYTTVFQSTLPVGEATFEQCYHAKETENFNPRFPWGKRRRPSISGIIYLQFQSTLPVGEATAYALMCVLVLLYFNPRFPWGKRRRRILSSTATFAFQSTLPVGEATVQVVPCGPVVGDFNPRFPWGKRPSRICLVSSCSSISIHASRGGSDVEACFLQ